MTLTRIALAFIALSLAAEEPKPTPTLQSQSAEIASLKDKLAKAEENLKRVTEKANWEQAMCQSQVQTARQLQEVATCQATGGVPQSGPQGIVCQPKPVPPATPAQ